MIIKSRKLIVAVCSFTAVLVLFLLYSRITDTGPVEIGPKVAPGVSDIEWEGSGQASGQLGQAKLGHVRKAKYVARDREWGFDKLLNPDEGGNDWKLEKPYMKIFKPNFRSDITADTGLVWVEFAAGKPGPKDALLSGNVIIHIFPDEARNLKDSYIYLDDVTFVSEKTQI